MVDLTIYLLCYNEEVLLPHTLKHYSTRFPNATFVIIDNESTDKSVEIAKEFGCEIYNWSTNNIANIIENLKLKDNIWKSAKTDWILIADMDEWLEITQEQLDLEDSRGITILRSRGVQIVAESDSLLLDDIDLHSLKNGYYDNNYDKIICFKRSVITDINYTRGAHKANPKGNVVFQKVPYILKHMNFLGLPWYKAKMKARFLRTDFNRNKLRCSGHYSNNDTVILDKFNRVRSATKINLI
jgi:glycosyltransferase involved in cell wall biosynthesis